MLSATTLSARTILFNADINPLRIEYNKFLLELSLKLWWSGKFDAKNCFTYQYLTKFMLFSLNKQMTKKYYLAHPRKFNPWQQQVYQNCRKKMGKKTANKTYTNKYETETFILCKIVVFSISLVFCVVPYSLNANKKRMLKKKKIQNETSFIIVNCLVRNTLCDCIILYKNIVCSLCTV